MKRFLLLAALTILVGACSSSATDRSETALVVNETEADSDSSTETGGDVDDSESSAATTTTTAEPAATTTEVAPTTAAAGSDVAAGTEVRSLVPDCAAVGNVAVGVETGTIVSGGSEYEYQWTVPSSYVGEPIPVVLDFHGLGSTGAQQAAFSGWSLKAEAEGFLSVQPTGLAAGGDGRNSWELPQFDTDLRDDVAMVSDLLDHVAASVCIDPARVYATGMSNGGFFTSELVCDMSDRIAAAMSVAGVTHHESCTPSRPVPYIAFHGTNDETVPFGGGESSLDPTGSQSDFFAQVMPEEFAEFAADFSCAEPTDTPITAEVTLTSWSGCANEVELGFYTLTGAGHTWPGSTISAAIPSLGVTNVDVDATAIGWEFFSRHSLAPE